MRVALLTDRIFPYHIGGMEKHSYNLAIGLAQRGIDVDLYCTPPADIASYDALACPGLRVLPLKFPSLPYFPGHYLLASYLYSRRLFGEVRKHTPGDFVYAQGFAGWALLDAKLSGLRAPPVGVNFHGLNMFQPAGSFGVALQQQMFRPAAKHCLAAADFVFSLGGRLTPLILGQGVPQTRILTVPIGISEEWILPQVPPRTGPAVFVYVGRFERLKGIKELTRAITALPEQCDARFIFVGPIPGSERLISSRVEYTGQIDDPELLRSIIRNADVLVCPSHSEGMPTVILEAMASGLAVIATDVGAVREVVDETNGWLVSAGDERQLLTLLVSVAGTSRAQLARMGEVGRRRVRDYTLNSMVTKTIMAIQRAIEN